MSSLLRPTWVFFGDSITQQGAGPHGWVSSIQDTYQRKVDVINRGYSGYNTRMAKLVLPHIFPARAASGSEGGHMPPAPALVVIFFGANDAALPDRTSSRQHVPLDTYVNNLRSMVTYLKKEVGVRTVVMVTPPPVSEAHRILHAKNTYGIDLPKGSERTVEVTGRYAAACKGLAAEMEVPCVDLFDTFIGVDGYGDTLLNDGLHLTPAGNRLVADVLIEVLRSLKFRTEEMALDVPLWDAMCGPGDVTGLSESMLEDAANKVLREHLKRYDRWKAENDWSGSRRFDEWMKMIGAPDGDEWH